VVAEPASAAVHLVDGTYEEARAMVGTSGGVEVADKPVTIALIRYFCAMVHDANASYWDDEFARRHWGEVIAPPAMLLTWLLTTDWRPGAAEPHTMLLAKVPLPGTTVISVGTDTEFFQPMRAGDRLQVEETLVDVSERKAMALGDGHFLTTESVFRLEDGTLVARYRHELFRYTPRTADDGG
jgi:acyl dehydratase